MESRELRARARAYMCARTYIRVCVCMCVSYVRVAVDYSRVFSSFPRAVLIVADDSDLRSFLGRLKVYDEMWQ